MNFQLSLHSGLLLLCYPQRKVHFYNASHSALLRRCCYFWTVSLLQSLGFILFVWGFLFCFIFFILVVSSQLVTTKNADIGILLMCFCSVVLPQQFEKLKQTNPSNCVSKVLEFNNLMQKSR